MARMKQSYLSAFLGLSASLVIFAPNHVSGFVSLLSGKCPPNPIPPTAEQFSAPFSTCSQTVVKQLASRNPDQNKNTAEILETYGYPYKTYNVTTQDGYILNVYRITGSPNRNDSDGVGRKQAVYLQHGMTLSSECWNFQPDSRNLPFKLADAGYEVWLGNSRGTTYSLGHTTLDSAVDLEYWNFSWDEMGKYDVPAVTDKILEETGNERIFFVGHSMGTTQYFVSLAEVSGMNDKIHAGFMLAPIGYMGHMNNVVRTVVPLADTYSTYNAINLALRGRISSAVTLRDQFNLSPGDLCDPTAIKCGLCDNFCFAIFGFDAPQINNTQLSNLFAKVPNSISVKCLAHYAQSISGCGFRRYDYGTSALNIKAYGKSTPPDYQLNKITAPTFFFYGEQDNFGPPNDVMITASKFGVAPTLIKVDTPLFNHLDFIIAKDADLLVYNRILEEIQNFNYTA